MLVVNRMVNGLGVKVSDCLTSLTSAGVPRNLSRGFHGYWRKVDSVEVMLEEINCYTVLLCVTELEIR